MLDKNVCKKVLDKVLKVQKHSLPSLKDFKLKLSKHLDFNKKLSLLALL